MRPDKKLLLLILALCLFLSGCVTPASSPDTCTVLFEDNPDLLFSRQVCQVERFGSLSVSVGVPKGQRIASVGYGDYTVSAKTDQSEHYDYYTVTLRRIRYSALVRITTAPAYTTAYHGDGGESITVEEDSPHLYFNTLPWREQFRREGYLPMGWNTRPDGSGTYVGFGSRIDHTSASHLDLYVQWLPCSEAADFTCRIENGGAVITGYRGSGNVVIPPEMEGFPVTAIASGAFGDLDVSVLALPASLRTVESGAFGKVSAADFYFFDSVETLEEDSFGSYRFSSIHIQAVGDPVYSGSYFDTFADKMDYLRSLGGRRKMVLFCGSSARFGYDSPMLEQAFPDYRVVNMGVYAYSNMRPQAELILQYMREGDILLSSPELDAIDTQFCGETDLDRETFCMMESDYDLFSRLDCTGYTGIFAAFSAYNRSRRDMTPRSYQDSARYYDEDGARQLTDTYNLQGDYILYRPNNPDRKAFGVKRAYYNAGHIRMTDLEGLNRVYDAFAEKGVTVLFTYSPRSSVSVSDDSTPEAIAALDAFLRTHIHAAVISSIQDSLMDPCYFYATDNHLSTEGVAVRTRQVIEDLRTALKPG